MKWEANMGAAAGTAQGTASGCGPPEMPPETIKVITSALSASNRRTWLLGNTSKFPAKLYDWGKYTATWSLRPKKFRSCRVTKPRASMCPFGVRVTITG